MGSVVSAEDKPGTLQAVMQVYKFSVFGEVILNGVHGNNKAHKTAKSVLQNDVPYESSWTAICTRIVIHGVLLTVRISRYILHCT
jgi:hypothetical protein